MKYYTYPKVYGYGAKEGVVFTRIEDRTAHKAWMAFQKWVVPRGHEIIQVIQMATGGSYNLSCINIVHAPKRLAAHERRKLSNDGE